MSPRYRLVVLIGLLCLGCSDGDSKEQAEEGDISSMPDLPVKPNDGNAPPRLHKIGNKEVQVNEELVILLAADDDDGNTLTYSVYGDMPGEAKFFKPEGKFVWLPTTTGGPYFVTFVVSDMKDFDSETVELRAVKNKTQHAPLFAPLGDQYLPIGVLYELRLDATDEDGDNLYFNIQGGVPAGATFDAPNALFRWTPGKADEGKLVRVTFQVSDGSLTDEMEVRLIVEGGALDNHPPVIQPIGAVEAEVAKLVSFEVKASDPDGNPLTYSVEGSLPAGASFNPATHVFSWTPPASEQGKSVPVLCTVTDGTYTVKEKASIMVKAKSVGCADDEFEPNNESPQAKQITEGTFQGLSICDTALSPIDEDWYKLLLTSGEHLSVTIEFNHIQGDLDLLLYAEANPNKPVFYSPGVGDVETVEWTAPAAGTYLIRVAGTQSMTYAVPYVMEVVRSTGQTCAPDSKEPNDQANTATPLTSLPNGQPTSGLSICPMDLDVFYASLQCGESLLASIEFDNDVGDLDLYLLDSTGEVILDQATSSNDIETVVLDGTAASSTYYVVVSGYPVETTTNTYSFEYLLEEGGSCTDDVAEPNDSSSQTETVSKTGSLTGLTLCCDKDWFSFPGTSGEVTVTLSLGGGGELKAWFSNSDSPTAVQGLQCLASGCTGKQDLPSQGMLLLSVEGSYGTQYTLEAVVETSTGANSCVGKCNQKVGDCWCDDGCTDWGDCCSDVCTACGYCG